MQDRIPRKLDAQTVRNSIRDADAFCRQLGLITPGAPRKLKHNVKCPWCGGTMNVWPARDSVMGSCKGSCVGKQHYDPLAIIAKIKGLAATGADFQRVLEIAAGIAGISQPPAPPPAQSAQPPAQPPQEVAGGEEYEEPMTCKLHPEKTPAEWTWIASLGIDPHAVRDREWLQVLDGPQPDEDFERLRQGGFTLLVDEEIAVSPSSGAEKPIYKQACAASESARDAFSDGLTAWPLASRDRPKFFLCLGARDFIVAEPHLQRRFLPVAAVTHGGLRGELLDRIPARAELIILAPGQEPAAAKLMRELAHAGRTARIRPLDEVLPQRARIEIEDRAPFALAPTDGELDRMLRGMGALN